MNTGESFYTMARSATVGADLPLRLLDQPSEAALAQPCFKLVLFEQGPAVVRVGGAAVPIAGPTLLCLNTRESARIPAAARCRALLFLPEVVNCAASAAALESEVGVLHVSGQLDRYWADAFLSRDHVRPRSLELPPYAARCLSDRFDRIRRELDEQRCRFWASWARSLLIETLHLLGQLHHSPARETNHPSQYPDHPAAGVVLYLQARYNERLTLEGLAREFHTNRTTLQQQFRAYTGKTIAAYLREQRLTVARSLLRDTALPVSEIAARTGFSDPTTFARSFRKAYRMGPARFRRLRRPA